MPEESDCFHLALVMSPSLSRIQNLVEASSLDSIGSRSLATATLVQIQNSITELLRTKKHKNLIRKNNRRCRPKKSHCKPVKKRCCSNETYRYPISNNQSFGSGFGSLLDPDSDPHWIRIFGDPGSGSRSASEMRIRIHAL